MEFLQILAPIIGPLVVAVLKTYVTPNIPTALLPLLATLFGSVAAHFGGADPTTAAALGASGVAIREVLDQAKKSVQG